MATATVSVTVNGMSVKQFLGQEKSIEISRFLADEFRSMSRMRYRGASSSSSKNVSKPVDLGNGVLRCA